MALLPLLRLRLGELTALLGSRSRALATLRWLHAPGPAPTQWPSTLPGVGAAALAELIQRCSLPTFRVVQRERANDGTTKLAVELEGHTVESVLIPSLTRSTVCLSSQSGCSRKCRFCATATLGFGRNLRAEEMLAQYLAARAEAPPDRPVRNVVFMGMGEPLDNLDEVLRAVELLTQPPAPQLGLEQVTVSTSGVLPGMVRFLAECRASLALSLNATTDGQRAELMPQTLQWPISALLGALRAGQAAHPRRVHFIEYVLFEGFNDSDSDAQRLVELLQGVNARVNLIPHNPFSGSELRPPTRERVQRFQQVVAAGRRRCLVRWPRGGEISAACGQLALRSAATAS